MITVSRLIELSKTDEWNELGQTGDLVFKNCPECRGEGKILRRTRANFAAINMGRRRLGLPELEQEYSCPECDGIGKGVVVSTFALRDLPPAFDVPEKTVVFLSRPLLSLATALVAVSFDEVIGVYEMILPFSRHLLCVRSDRGGEMPDTHFELLLPTRGSLIEKQNSPDRFGVDLSVSLWEDLE